MVNSLVSENSWLVAKSFFFGISFWKCYFELLLCYYLFVYIFEAPPRIMPYSIMDWDRQSIFERSILTGGRVKWRDNHYYLWKIFYVSTYLFDYFWLFFIFLVDHNNICSHGHFVQIAPTPLRLHWNILCTIKIIYCRNRPNVVRFMYLPLSMYLCTCFIFK